MSKRRGLVGKNELLVGDQQTPPFASRVDLSSNRRGFLRLKNFSSVTGLGAHCSGSKLSFPPGRAGSLWLFSVQWAADRLNGDGAVREPPYACDTCHYACPATTGRCAPVRCRWCRCEGQAWGMRGAVPPAAWAFAILLASDMLFLRLFPGSFALFAFSHSAIFLLRVANRYRYQTILIGIGNTAALSCPIRYQFWRCRYRIQYIAIYRVPSVAPASFCAFGILSAQNGVESASKTKASTLCFNPFPI